MDLKTRVFSLCTITGISETYNIGSLALENPSLIIFTNLVRRAALTLSEYFSSINTS